MRALRCLAPVARALGLREEILLLLRGESVCLHAIVWSCVQAMHDLSDLPYFHIVFILDHRNLPEILVWNIQLTFIDPIEQILPVVGVGRRLR